MKWLGRVWSGFRRALAPVPRAPEPQEPADPLHLMRGMGTALCGAKNPRRWTIEIGMETCPTCKARGRMINVRRQTNDR